MSLPESRNTTYVNGATPEIDADDLNQLQDDDVELHKYIRNSNIILEDDFSGSAIDTGLWTITGAPVTSGLTGTTGVAVFAAAGRNVDIGFVQTSADWGYTILAEFNGFSGWAATAQARLGALAHAEFYATAGTANIQILTNAGGGTITDSGVAVTDTGYFKLQAKCIGGTLKFYINGSEIAAASTTTIPTEVELNLGMYTANGTLRVDLIRFWAQR
jgi:hypothetical protein